MTKNTKVILAGSSIIVAILILLIAATPGASGTEIPLAQAVANPGQYEDRYINTEGFLVEESIDWRADEIELRFDIEDEDGNVLSVLHERVRPDNFSDGVIVLLGGYIQPDGIFYAETVQTRCPSVYEGEKPDEDYDPSVHQDVGNDD
ncbi:hypothetical protein BKP35_04525 [Anaerobacillus arseniciselenatis]|uniref:Cytochrome c maturation protein CcmE n=1 Tax=Anaerobacillus arseniciselenatis TaxID=85682 RepID=A0A1S2LUN8_9BACI|nr:cytochrome c maturation protein CcmE [Anaerobacillus arseniciselenatis]OIJ16242.1 hypothetical protein BKP35_04525 [Anaerobacillus arseniciselenatis]